MATAVSQGLLTFAFTDIVGSTRLWERAPSAMHAALKRHNEILYGSVRAEHGTIFKTVGDACCCVFDSAAEAVRAAIAVQQTLAQERWDPEIGHLRVRIGIHSGTAVEQHGDYFGPALNRVARLVSAGHAQQILLSEAALAEIDGALEGECRVEDLGAHRLKDLAEPQHIYQVIAAGLPEAYPPPASLDARPNNLPSQLSSFVGREREMSDLRELVAHNRLVTVCGLGGVGKTRLALQIAADTIGRYSDGSWLVRLADFESPDLVAHAVASTLHVAETPGQDILQTLAEQLRDRHLFLLLDNAEQVLQATAAIARTLLTSCPGLRVLVTSREPLHLPGERVLRLGRMVGTDAADLFSERAALGSGDREVSRICDRLGGVPLAIEIAAGRIGTLSTAQLAQRLDALLPTLVSKDATQEQRHRTLRATMDWSYRLLGAQEQRFFNRLAVFEGGFTLEACEALAPEADEAAYELLDALVDKSFVAAEPAGETMRYRLLELLREFGCEQLQQSPDMREAHERHFAYYKAFAERTDVTSLGAELPNLRAALEWGFAQEDREPGFEMLLRVALYWQLHGNVSEGRSWFARACEAADGTPNPMLGKLLRRAATFATIEDEYETARDLTEQARDVFGAVGDRAGVAEALHNLAVIEDRSGSAAEARRLYTMALSEFEQTGHTIGIITAMYNVAQSFMHAGEYPEAKTHFERGMALCTAPEHADRLASFAHALGDVALKCGDYDEAQRNFERALEMKRGMESRHDEVEALFSLASLQFRRSDPSAARAYAREAAQITRELNVPSLVIGCFELHAVLASGSGDPQRAHTLAALALEMRRKYHYVYGILDDLAPEVRALCESRALPHASADDAARMLNELAAG